MGIAQQSVQVIDDVGLPRTRQKIKVVQQQVGSPDGAIDNELINRLLVVVQLALKRLQFLFFERRRSSKTIFRTVAQSCLGNSTFFYFGAHRLRTGALLVFNNICSHWRRKE